MPNTITDCVDSTEDLQITAEEIIAGVIFDFAQQGDLLAFQFSEEDCAELGREAFRRITDAGITINR